MSVIFNQMFSRYTILTKDDEINATHEIMQQITLAALYRSGFYDKATFYGGTCLRIFYNLPRFSEDLDFSLLQKDESFNIENYFDSIYSEFKALGRDIIITKKNKKNSDIESAFLKDNTDIYNISFQTQKAIKIKIEVDKTPPLKFNTQYNLLLQPFSFNTRCFDIESLFAGKIHAFLFRNWKTRIKGRDWFDFEWYVKNSYGLNFIHFKERALQSGHVNNSFSKDDFKQLMVERIKSVDLNLVKKDVRPFIKNEKDLNFWTTDYFIQLTNLIKYSSESNIILE